MSAPPPAYQSAVPAAGIRVPTSTTSSFPQGQLGPAPFNDLDGSPVYVCSALLESGERGVHPGKAVRGQCMISYGGAEVAHVGRYDILPITEAMEWVPTSRGQIPKGRRPVEGGFEETGAHLFHALVHIDGVHVPAKTGEHLGGANAPWGGAEVVHTENYEILCWR
ncbi:hypothetical protein BCR35DRAFT_322725 [Leucosporidium creatinivorum]|uniref:Uncharacterized protein n=1 Tax=Leucosporidium creatinivorum TaxID=106004 RepID=A0A1Y2D7A3_9BASI|nr:hypothetical protein BCR35DRAFT_322725 [Leucosporidium creatinivorum]